MIGSGPHEPIGLRDFHCSLPISARVSSFLEFVCQSFRVQGLQFFFQSLRAILGFRV